MDWNSYDLFSTIAAVGLIGVTQLSVFMKIILILIGLVLPVVIFELWNSGRVVLARVSQYSQIYSLAEQYRQQATHATQTASLVTQSFSAIGIVAFRVTNVIKKNGKLLLLLSQGDTGAAVAGLPVGRKVVVHDILTGETLGVFIINGTRQDGYLAEEYQIVNAVWWGYLHEHGEAHIQSPLNATAFLLSDPNGGA